MLAQLLHNDFIHLPDLLWRRAALLQHHYSYAYACSAVSVTIQASLHCIERASTAFPNHPSAAAATAAAVPLLLLQAAARLPLADSCACVQPRSRLCRCSGSHALHGGAVSAGQRCRPARWSNAAAAAGPTRCWHSPSKQQLAMKGPRRPCVMAG